MVLVAELLDGVELVTEGLEEVGDVALGPLLGECAEVGVDGLGSQFLLAHYIRIYMDQTLKKSFLELSSFLQGKRGGEIWV